MKQVLFICTGNYYRSRFAEAVFNHHADEAGLNWKAFSRGVAIHLVTEGELSDHTREALAQRRIGHHHTAATRRQIAAGDLEHADLIVALDDTEHRPILARMFPDWAKRITFWNVADIPQTSPHEALPAIEAQVQTLVASLQKDAELDPPRE